MEQEMIVSKPNGAALAVKVDPLSILQLAIERGAGIETIERMVALVNGERERIAKQQFDEAMGKFKDNPPTILKNKHVEFGNTKYDHATLDEVSAKIADGLGKVGIRHRWETAQDKEIAVTCVLAGFGHEERTTLKATADTSGSKNSIQAIGSAVTYLQRYTLLLACGMAAKGQDDDGRATGLGSNWIAEHCEWLMNASTPAELQKMFGAYYTEARAAKDRDAMAAIITAKDARKKQLL